jgi:hypothetical protein
MEPILSCDAEQLRRLGLSPILAETLAGLFDRHEIALLAARGYLPELATRDRTLSRADATETPRSTR